MTLRDKRQEEFANVFMDRSTQKGRGILYLCPRFGKCRTAIRIFEKLGKFPSILIAYPDKEIKQSWIEEMKEVGYNNPNITFTTHLSLKKHISGKFDIVVIDEIHLLSDAQINDSQPFMEGLVLGLTGTMSSWTERELSKRLEMNVLARYPIFKAIEEGVVTDYEITVKLVDLDDIIKNVYKSSVRTEKAQFIAYGKVIDKLEQEGKETFYLRLARMRIIQNSLAKLNATRKILNDNKDDRILVFCGLIDIAEKLGCPVFHSKSDSSEDFDNFLNGQGNHMAVVKIGNTGKTYRPLNKVIINYFDSNSENLAQKIFRCMGMEYNNPGKKASIIIVSSTEPTEKKWLDKALEFFDKTKIKYEKV